MQSEKKFLGLTESERLVGPLGIFQLVFMLIGSAAGCFLVIPLCFDVVGSELAASFSDEARSPVAAGTGLLFLLTTLSFAIKERRLIRAFFVNIAALFLLR